MKVVHTFSSVTFFKVCLKMLAAPYMASVIDEWMWNIDRMILRGRTRSTRKKSCTSASLSTTGPHGLAWDQTYSLKKQHTVLHVFKLWSWILYQI